VSRNAMRGRIPYHVPDRAPVHLAIHAVRGARISVLVDEADHPAGSFVAEFELCGAEADMYYYNLCVGSRVTTRPL